MNKVEKHELINAYGALCDSPEGQLVFLDLINFCAPLVFAAENTEQLWLREGQRSVFTHIINMIQEAHPHNYSNLLKLHADKVAAVQAHQKIEEGKNESKNKNQR